MDKEIHTVMILIDPKIASNTSKQTLRQQKIEYTGFDESIIKWFKSYIKQNFFLWLDIFSEAELMYFCVPYQYFLEMAFYLI